MDIHSLKAKCIEAAQFYYLYLEKKNKGREEINISSKRPINKENDICELRIGSKLFNTDSIEIENRQHNEKYISGKDFLIEEYDADNKLLIIRFLTENHFSETPAGNLKIISDLKFLVKNVETWFTNNGQEISFHSESMSGLNDLPPLILNDSQREAFKNILNKKYNYVWGPPGTGKTCFTLSSAVLHYLKQDNPKIGIFAPTNNTLERVLSPIIDHLDKIGIPREKVLRIGAPSRKYAKEYPETCEIQGLDKQLKEIAGQIEIIKNVMKYRRGQRVFGSIFDIQKDIQRIIELQKKYRELLAVKDQKKNEYAALIKESKSLTHQFKRILSIETKDYQRLINKKEYELFEVKNQIDLINTEVNENILNISNADIQSDKITGLLRNVNIRNFSEKAEQLTQVQNEIDNYLSVNASLEGEYLNCNDSDLEKMLKQYEEQYADLKNKRIEERINNCSIIGMTLDSFIGRFSDVRINFSNIFLDEAGYAPLIKALTLFSNNCGITFLGDHKQLPPVCELDNYNEIPQFYNFLWSKPSIFFEMVFCNNEEECLDTAGEIDCPEFRYTKKSILKESHRFGANLCDLLDKLIYKIGYKSALDDDLKLFYIDAENPIRNGRENENECHKISKLLNCCNHEEYCILTPYTDQVSLLHRNLHEASREERISTIHKSQGREWDTIILSTVDGSRIKPWFTNNANPNSPALYVLNTAISRACKELIIVCDKSYWSSKQDAEIQLLSNLLKISKPLDRVPS